MNQTANQEEAQPKFMLMANRDLAAVILLGGIVGLLTWGLGWLLGTYVFEPVLCSGDAARCLEAPAYGHAIASVLAAIAALLGLVRQRIFRPMLVVLAATISLWGLVGTLSTLAWYWVALASFVLYALAYGLYVWVVRVRRFWVAVIVVLVLVIAVRFALTY